jgi:hypothetical protein
MPARGKDTDRRVFQGFTPDVAKNVMARACKPAGILFTVTRTTYGTVTPR